ncbi:Fas apoptotic inhibitory molecule 1 [Trichinella murrelli]|uniref:Fas apoptotic inhibitory molecule 1 n=1 Tax=Trichinella murrelli TaxID=144512 RepID=A0A0V0TSR3_9BILA|nr:Fas apoptotic inhibitory molecule 1 [Trichinella murrelli]
MSHQKSSSSNLKDLVATWELLLNDGLHKIEFEHGTSSGRRVIRVDGKEVFRRDWVFKLVGCETFVLHGVSCKIIIEASGIFAYQYTLEVNGKPFEKFSEQMRRALKIWEVKLNGFIYKICLEKEKLDVYVNGKIIESHGEFVDNGMAINFEFSQHIARIQSSKANAAKSGLIYQLFVDNKEVQCTDG